MTDQLLPHQMTAAEFLSVRGPALLWDEMGLGKTASAIAGADKAGCQKILVCCPAAVKAIWAKEFTRWQMIARPITIIEGNPKVPPGEGVTIISHAAFANANATAELKKGSPYDLIIVDEVHAMREYSARRTAAVVGLADAAWRWTHRFWGLTGTPMVNSAADLWPVLAGPFYLMQSWAYFISQFTNVKADLVSPTGIKRAHELAEILRPHVLRRTMASIGIDLPLLEVNDYDIPINSAALDEISNDLADWTPERVRGMINADGDVHDGTLSRIRHTLGRAKVEPVAWHVQFLLENGSGPLVVFFHHTDVREHLFDILANECEYAVTWIDGKITPSQLAAAERCFQAGEIDVLLAQTQAAGQGLTLHAASTCVQAELPWTSVAVDQANKRIHRIGQTKPCEAHILRAQDCWLEDVMASIVDSKRAAADKLLNLLTTNH